MHKAVVGAQMQFCWQMSKHSHHIISSEMKLTENLNLHNSLSTIVYFFKRTLQIRENNES